MIAYRIILEDLIIDMSYNDAHISWSVLLSDGIDVAAASATNLEVQALLALSAGDTEERVNDVFYPIAEAWLARNNIPNSLRPIP